jgi:predicted Na+-dependent transporter
VGPLIVAVLFLMSFTLPFGRLLRAAANLRALLLATAVSYVLTPALCWAAASLLPLSEPEAVGLLILGALPCTLASAVVWTRMAGGNDAVPMVFTALSNSLTFAIAPLVLWVTLSTWIPVEAGPMAAKLFTRVLLPVVAGQVLRAVAPKVAERIHRHVSFVVRLLVLLIVLVAVSLAADDIRDRPAATAAMLLLAATLHGLTLLASRKAAGRIGLSRADAVGTAFAASQKSLYVGVYLAAEFYAEIPGALVPLLAYHVVQLVIDTVVAEHEFRRGDPKM